MTTKRLNRNEFEQLSSKRQKEYVKKVYPLIRIELIRDHWDNYDAYDHGGIRNTVHHCWEKGMGGAIPLWYYIDKRNMLLWSLSVHFNFHNESKTKWTNKMKGSAKKSEQIKQEMIDDNRNYIQAQGTAYKGLAKNS